MNINLVFMVEKAATQFIYLYEQSSTKRKGRIAIGETHLCAFSKKKRWILSIIDLPQNELLLLVHFKIDTNANKKKTNTRK